MSSYFSGITSAAAALTFLFFVGVTAQGDMCGKPAADPTKTCISIRLPWNPTPMYFCVEKTKFRYRNQCQNRFTNQCGVNAARQDILIVQDSWSCCPLVSYPDSCANQQCQPAPLGRKCQTMEPNAANPCCDSYFCEENMTPDTCQFKRLEPTCNQVPQGKTNCIAFVDPYGCCPKFQCDGEGKPGQCPAELQAMQYMNRFNSSAMLTMGRPGGLGRGGMMGALGMGPAAGMGGMNMGPTGAAGQSEMLVENIAGGGQQGLSGPHNANFILSLAAGVAVGGGGLNLQNRIPCIGDSNCPGSMKCCSNDMNVYMKEGMAFVYRNKNPTYGYCVEPQVTQAIKYVTVAENQIKQ